MSDLSQIPTDQLVQMLASHPDVGGGGAQPSIMDRIIASPPGRLFHDVVQRPLTAVERFISDQRWGPYFLGEPYLPRLMQQDAASAEANYQAALARNRNTTGYAPARADADKMLAPRPNALGFPTLHSGFQDQVTAPFNPALSALGAGIATGFNLDKMNAAADVQTAAQDAYQKQHPYLSIGANVIGGLAQGAPTGLVRDAATLARTTPLNQEIITPEDLNKAKDAAYSIVDKSPMKIGKDAVKSLYDDVSAAFARRGLNDDTISQLAPKSSTALASLKAAGGSDQTLQGMDIQRRIAGIAAAAPDKADRAAARIMQDKIDDFIGNLQPSQLTGPIDQAAIDALPLARDLASRSFRAQKIQSVIDKAGVNGSSYTASGYENALRSGFRKLANNDRAMARFSPEEQDAINQVTTGGSPWSATNLLRQVGKLSPQGVVPMMAEMGAVASFGPHALAIPAAGLAGRLGATALTKSSAQRALDLALMGGNLPKLRSAGIFQMPKITSQTPLPGPFNILGSIRDNESSQQ